MIKTINKILIISLIVIISGIDIFLKPGLITCIAIAFLTSVVAFSLGLSDIRLGKYTTILLLAANVVLLYFTLNIRFYFINIFLLSYILWQFITPFLARFKNFIGFSILILFPVAYFIPLYNIKIPLLPFVFYPLFAVGYSMRDLKLSKSIKLLLLLIANALFSAGALSAVSFKAGIASTAGTLKFLTLSNPGSVLAVYLPFVAVFLIWFFLSLCLLTRYILRNYINETANKEEFEEYFNGILRYVFNFIAFFVVTGFFMFISEYVLRGSIRKTLGMIMDPPAMFNLLFLASVYLVFIAVIGRGLATTIMSIVVGLLVIANFIKIRYFDEPFYPWDTYLIKEAITIARGYVNFTLVIVLAAVLILGIAAAFIFIKPIRKIFKPKLNLTILLVALAMVLINGLLLNNTEKLADLNIKKSWYIGKNEILANGLMVQNYFYIKNYNEYAFNKPDGYSQEKMVEITKKLSEKTVQATGSTVKPNIIMIMDESYWDPTRFNGVTFNQDIMQGYEKYKKGNIISPAVGGGTANVEFEALTGLTTYFMGPGALAYNIYFRRDTPSIVSVMNENGYSTTAIHPYHAEMYNRNKVYKYLQFNEFMDINTFDLKTDLKGPYVSDEKVVERILDILGEGGKPKFIFALTMQNHDPYVDKYKKLEVTAKSDKLNPKETDILSTYAEGVNDGSKALDKLITTLQKSKTPTLVYFFGDHLPRLGSLQDMLNIYDRLNPESSPDKKTMRTYSPPYASWSNFKQTRTFDPPMSPSHIALEILKDSGVTYPSYFNELELLEKDFPYLQKSINGNIDMNNQNIKDYRLIQYDILFGNQYVWDKK